MEQTAAAIRRKGSLLELAGASVLVLVLFPAVEASKFGVLAPYGVLLLGCTTVLLSPAVADLARRAAESAQEIFDAPPTAARVATELRWAGFTCILFYAVCVAGDISARAAAAKEMSVERVCGLLLFLVFLVGVWTVSLSMLTGRVPGRRRRRRRRKKNSTVERSMAWWLGSHMPLHERFGTSNTLAPL